MLVADSFRIIAESQSPLLAADVARRQRPKPHLFPKPLDLSHHAALGDYARHVQTPGTALPHDRIQPDSPRIWIRTDELPTLTAKKSKTTRQERVVVQM